MSINIHHISSLWKDHKFFLINLISILALSTALTSCDDDDYYYSDQVFDCLTSQTWGYENDYLDSYGQPAYEAAYFDFYTNYTGSYEIYTESSVYPPMQSVISFRWGFTDPSCSVIMLQYQNGTVEYWSIDRISFSYFSSYVSDYDPNRYPGTDWYYQELWPMF